MYSFISMKREGTITNIMKEIGGGMCELLSFKVLSRESWQKDM